MSQNASASTSWDTLQPAQFNTIFDTPGKLSASTSLKYLKPKGVYVTPAPDMLSFLWGKLVSLFTSKSVKMIMVESKKVDLELSASTQEEENV